MSPDECYWIGAKGGLVKEKHRRCMGDAIWFFLWCLLKQTGVNDAEEGIVCYGHPQTRAEISEKTGFPEWQIKKWISRLRATEYIRTEDRAVEGVIIFVQKAKDKTKRPGTNQHRVKPQPGTNQHRGYQIAPGQTTEDKKVSFIGGSPIPKDLSYYNKDAADAVHSHLFKSTELPKPKSIAQQKRELREKGYLQ